MANIFLSEKCLSFLSTDLFPASMFLPFPCIFKQKVKNSFTAHKLTKFVYLIMWRLGYSFIVCYYSVSELFVSSGKLISECSQNEFWNRWLLKIWDYTPFEILCKIIAVYIKLRFPKLYKNYFKYSYSGLTLTLN